nr:hypothetical protein [Haematobacter sp.]
MADPRCIWSMGGPGAVLGLAGADLGRRGALHLRLPPDLRPLAFEVLSSDPEGWNHGISLCLPETVSHAVERAPEGEVEIPTGSRLIRLSHRGRDWIARGPLGRLEVWDRDPPLLGDTRRTHPATTPVPAGLLPFAHAFPAHPCRHRPGVARPFDVEDHAAFQRLLARFGPPDLVALKTAVRRAVRAGEDLPVPAGRHGRAQLRVALRQERLLAPCFHLDRLIVRHDPPLARHLGIGL